MEKLLQTVSGKKCSALGIFPPTEMENEDTEIVVKVNTFTTVHMYNRKVSPLHAHARRIANSKTLANRACGWAGQRFRDASRPQASRRLRHCWGKSMSTYSA